jgi:hypothetical protein
LSSRKQKPALGKWVLGAAVIFGIAAALQFNLIPGSDVILGATALAHETTKPPVPVIGLPDTATSDPIADQQKQLAQREADLQAQEASVKERETQVADLLQDLSGQRTTADVVRRVADMYAAMPPFKAAPMLQTLDTETAVSILQLLDQDQAGAILAYMAPARGGELTTLLIKPQPAQSKP